MSVVTVILRALMSLVPYDMAAVMTFVTMIWGAVMSLGGYDMVAVVSFGYYDMISCDVFR